MNQFDAECAVCQEAQREGISHDEAMRRVKIREAHMIEQAGWVAHTIRGTSSGAPCHYAHANGQQLWITEGPLKADFVANRIGQPCLGIAGVANWRSALPLLGDAQEVILAFDQDPPGPAREAVENNARALAQALSERGVKALLATWDWTLAKGLDDALRASVPITVT